MHFDFALTCHAPIGPGSDEVGAYSYHLLNTLATAGRLCVVFTGTPVSPETRSRLPASIEWSQVHLPPIEAGPHSPMDDGELRYTHALHEHLLAFLRTHSIQLIEFPSVGAEGYVFINHNLVYRLVPCVAVRLHPPLFLIDEDNGHRACSLPSALVYAAELEALQSADHVIYQGGALLERMLRCFAPGASAALRTRCVHLPHPQPLPDAPAISGAASPSAPRSRPTLVCPGPLEYRAGTDRLVINALAWFARHPEPRPLIVCLGPDTLSAEGKSFAAYLRTLVPETHKNDFVFDTDSAGDARQAWLHAADAWVLPARFAHHSAALHDLIAQGKPAYVSDQGDLPALVAPYSWIKTFDPADSTAWPAIFQAATLSDHSAFAIRPSSFLPPPPESLASRYTGLPAPVPVSLPPVRLALVIAHLDDLENLTALLARLHEDPQRDRLELIVVDDGSTPATWEKLTALAALRPAPALTLLRTPQPRSGPFTAREIGTQAARSDLVAYVDADDYIDTHRYLAYAQALAHNPALDIIIPTMRCFGLETHAWRPLPKARFTAFFTDFAHVGLIGRKPLLLQAFARARPSIEHLAHAEDCLFSLSLLFLDAKITALAEFAYYYNRTTPRTRSQLNPARLWHSRLARSAHFNRCMTEALALGTLTPLDLRIIRHAALHLPPNYLDAPPPTRGNRAPWHTHLYRALRSLCGDRRYAP